MRGSRKQSRAVRCSERQLASLTCLISDESCAAEVVPILRSITHGSRIPTVRSSRQIVHLPGWPARLDGLAARLPRDASAIAVSRLRDVLASPPTAPGATLSSTLVSLSSGMLLAETRGFPSPARP